MKELTPEQRFFLDFSVEGKWMINPETGLVDVEGDFVMCDDMVKDGLLPVQFGTVTGFFSCGGNGLTTLKGCPILVLGDFDCDGNNLTSLRYAPKHTHGMFFPHRNQLRELGFTDEWIHKLVIDLREIDVSYHDTIIPEIEALIKNGTEIARPELLYYPFRDAYYDRKMVDLI